MSDDDVKRLAACKEYLKLPHVYGAIVNDLRWLIALAESQRGEIEQHKTDWMDRPAMQAGTRYIRPTSIEEGKKGLQQR